MDVKLGMHMYFSVSMTTMNKKWPQALFPITTSSLLKLPNHECMEVKLGMHIASFPGLPRLRVRLRGVIVAHVESLKWGRPGLKYHVR